MHTDEGWLRRSTTLRHFTIRPLAAFRERHPGIAFDFVSGTSTSQCLEAVRRDRADVAYVTVGVVENLELAPTVRTQWVLVVASDDPLALRTALRPRELDQIRAIGVGSTATSRSQLEQQLASHGVQLQFAATVDDWDTALRLAELGVGHAVVPAMWIHDLDEHHRLRAVPISGLSPVTFGWAARSWSSVPSFAATFTAMVDSEIAGFGPEARVELIG